MYSRYNSSSFFPVKWWSDCLISSKIAILAACHSSGFAATLCIAASVSLVSAIHSHSAVSPSIIEAVWSSLVYGTSLHTNEIRSHAPGSYTRGSPATLVLVVNMMIRPTFKILEMASICGIHFPALHDTCTSYLLNSMINQSNREDCFFSEFVFFFGSNM